MAPSMCPRPTQLRRAVSEPEDEAAEACADWSFDASALAQFLERRLQMCEGCDPRLRVFDSIDVPRMNVDAYAQRFQDRLRLEPACFVLAVIYIDRALASSRELGVEFRLTRRNAHRLLVTAVVLGAKVLQDRAPSNDYFARQAGLSLRELNLQELTLLSLLRWRCQVDLVEFSLIVEKLQGLSTSELSELELPKASVRPCFMQGYSQSASGGA